MSAERILLEVVLMNLALTRQLRPELITFSAFSLGAFRSVTNIFSTQEGSHKQTLFAHELCEEVLIMNEEQWELFGVKSV